MEQSLWNINKAAIKELLFFILNIKDLYSIDMKKWNTYKLYTGVFFVKM